MHPLWTIAIKRPGLRGIVQSMLEEQTECVRFDSYTFVALVDRVVVRQDRTLEFIFRNGMKYEYIIVV